MMPTLIAIAALLLGVTAWRHWMVVRFFRRSLPPPVSVSLVSIMQPILSGDPALPACLTANLRQRTSFRLEFLWLVDSDDLAGQRICRDLIAQHPACDVRLLVLPPPAVRENPKMIKLIAGAQAARGDVLCVLDDDTRLPDGGLETCLPFLDEPGVGLAFGLPYYVSFTNLWSSLVAVFVNSHSLLTYVPYTALAEPVTINGMFYALRRTVYEAIGGFAGLEHTLADDFAVAQRLRAHHYRLAQTPLCHAISTHVAGPRHYLNLIQRWFIFPRESVMHSLRGRERALLYGLGLAPAFVPWLIVLGLLAWPSPWLAGYALLYAGYCYAIVAHLNVAYLRRATPWRHSWLVLLVQMLFPIQIVAALLAPQRIVWRGHIIQAERGGGFRILKRRE